MVLADHFNSKLGFNKYDKNHHDRHTVRPVVHVGLRTTRGTIRSGFNAEVRYLNIKINHAGSKNGVIHRKHNNNRLITIHSEQNPQGPMTIYQLPLLINQGWGQGVALVCTAGVVAHIIYLYTLAVSPSLGGSRQRKENNIITRMVPTYSLHVVKGN